MKCAYHCLWSCVFLLRCPKDNVPCLFMYLFLKGPIYKLLLQLFCVFVIIQGIKPVEKYLKLQNKFLYHITDGSGGAQAVAQGHPLTIGLVV